MIQGGFNRFRAGDQPFGVFSLLLAVVDKFHDGLDFRLHTARAKLPFANKRFGLFHAEIAQPLLLRRAKIHGDLLHAGRDQQ